MLHSLERMTPAQRQFTLSVLGNRQASDGETEEVVDLLHQTGGIQHARDLARHYVQDALEHLRILDETPYKTLLRSWADFIIHRDL